MEDFLKMDIFFVVATVVMTLIGALVVVALVYAVRFLRTLNRVGDEFAEEAKAIREDVRAARARVKEEGFRAASLFSLFGKSVKRATRKKRATNE
ncbi:MAG TPA: hypothetical protein VGB97_01950 [Candidatus Paceibacterota bacterium]|jgi:hypothetical protein